MGLGLDPRETYTSPVSADVVPRVILIVDDDDDVRTLAAAIVEDLGHTPRVAPHGAAALAMLREDPSIAVLFTDIVMPGELSGFALARRAKELRPELKVLYATGYARAVLEEPVLLHGPILSKPYRRRDLAAALARVLGGSE